MNIKYSNLSKKQKIAGILLMFFIIGVVSLQIYFIVSGEAHYVIWWGARVSSLCPTITVLWNPVVSVEGATCNCWYSKGFPDAKTIDITSYDANKDGVLNPGQTCNSDNLETFSQYYYNIGPCDDPTGNNEHLIYTNVCDWAG